MRQIYETEIRDLLDRLSRINAAEDWTGRVNPTQRAALAYLAKANRFSRKPSQVADYLSATRGTVSQTLKALARKDLIRENRSETDKRSISYGITAEGMKELDHTAAVDVALSLMAEEDLENLSDQLKKLAKELLRQREARPFGICLTCRHHQSGKSGAYCTLLDEPLQKEETDQICHEFE